MEKNPFHPARPLVSVVAVQGLGGRKTFHRVAAILIHLPVAHHPMQRALVKIKESSAPHVLQPQTVIFQLIWVICTFTVLQKYFYILAQQNFQILFEFRMQESTFASDVEAYSSSPHIPNKSFAFY